MLECVSEYDFLLPFDMEVLKGQIVHEIPELIRNIQYFSGNVA